MKIYNFIKSMNTKELLLFGLLISIIFTHFFHFQYVKYYIQFTEIIFSIAVVYLITNYNQLRRFKLERIDYSFIFLAFILILNLVTHAFINVAIQVFASIYLISLYFIFVILLKNIQYSRVKFILQICCEIGLWILIIIGLIGLPLHYFFGKNLFVLDYHNYPYFGNVFRIKGFSFSPNLYISLIVFFLCLVKYFNRLNIWYLVLLFFIALLSITKEASLLIGLLIIFSSEKILKISLRFKILIILFFGFIYLFFSLFYISINDLPILNENKLLISSTPIIKTDIFQIYSTTYYTLLKSGIIIFKQYFLIGVGIGQFQIYLSDLITNGFYPNYYNLYQPHDIYFGIASQLGFLYIIFIIFLFLEIGKIYKNKKNKIYHPIFLLSVYMMIESICIGSFHFRHYYMFFALIPYLMNIVEPVKNNEPIN